MKSLAFCVCLFGLQLFVFRMDVVAAPLATAQVSATQRTDLIVVGAGLAGLSAALEAGRAGAHVVVIEQSSIFGGHAVMSAADVTMIDTPLQRLKGVTDSPELATKDFLAWGVDPNKDWVRYYTQHSKADIYDWLTALGVRFEGLRKYPGNTVPRAHITAGLGLGLVRPVYIAGLKNHNITFVWNTVVNQLIFEHGSVLGVQAKNLRTRETAEYRSEAVILATGGFQSNLELALANWPADLPKPKVLLAGSGINSLGSGLTLARDVGASITNLDHQWNYERGLLDPRCPGMHRGLNASVAGVQVNATGNEFMDDTLPSDEALRLVLGQPGSTYWTVFDEASKHTFWISGSNWANFDVIQRVILDDTALVKKSQTLNGLAEITGLPADVLNNSVQAFNERGKPISNPPFYAVQFYPMTRKSMGGIAIDSAARAVDRNHHAVRGLYAAGEATGEAGINGKRSLEGTFLGPAVLTGRVAAQTAVKDFAMARRAWKPVVETVEPTPVGQSDTYFSCASCHRLQSLIDKPRSGFWHFERVHTVVLGSHLECAQCHSNMGAPATPTHRIDRLAQASTCDVCHQSH